VTKVVVAMSGGVDSSVTAALLKKEGYEVTGVTMAIWSGEACSSEDSRHGCYGSGEGEDIADAQNIARVLGIDFHVLDLRQQYKTAVLDFVCREYLSGRTPNPCIRCNCKVKFGALMQKTRDCGIEFDYFATGHYARVEYNGATNRYLLKSARDLDKDQSYFLYSLSQLQLNCSLFPLGNYTKKEVRKMASDFGLSVVNKPESQDFITGGYSSLIETSQPGLILDRQGNILGEHRGIPFYTIGQRKGLGISAKSPLYVVAIDCEKNAIIVGAKEELYRDELIASELNWISVEELEHPIMVKAKIRNSHEGAEATITPLSKEKICVKFKEPQMAITPGQAIVFYHEVIVVGGGTIESSTPVILR
jgi:tRNA-specific 2-thiouridylase